MEQCKYTINVIIYVKGNVTPADIQCHTYCMKFTNLRNNASLLAHNDAVVQIKHCPDKWIKMGTLFVLMLSNFF